VPASGRWGAGEPLEADALRRFCREAGYVEDERVDEVGEAAFRGEVVDLFPAGRRTPVRLEVLDGRLAALGTPAALKREFAAGSMDEVFVRLVRPSPASRNRSHTNDVAAWSPRRSLHLTMWPRRLGLRGLAALTTLELLVLLVSVT